jgi:replication factor C subunit 2/4
MDDFLSLNQTKPKPKLNMKQALWVEKYRPNKLDDLVQQSDVVSLLEKTISSGDLPHLLFHGGPGTGKTTTILALARRLYGDKYNKYVLELNASDERGINVVRNKIKSFSSLSVDSTCNVPYKLIILDEADAMTNESQFALRRIIEEYAHVTRFCLLCNYLHSIIEPIQSRCAKFRFKNISHDSMTLIVNRILNNEKIPTENYEPEAIDRMISLANGDLRHVINNLQKLVQVYNKVTMSIVEHNMDFISHDDLTDIYDILKSGMTADIFNWKNKIFYKGFSGNIVLRDLSTFLLSKNIKDVYKVKIAEICSICDDQLNNGSDQELQILNCLTQISAVLN